MDDNEKMAKEQLDYIFDDLNDYISDNNDKCYAVVAVDKEDVQNGKEYITLEEVIGDILFTGDVKNIIEYLDKKRD